MKLNKKIVGGSLFILGAILAYSGLRARAQERQNAKVSGGASASETKKSKGYKPLPRDNEGLEGIQEGQDFLRRRANWFFQPRAFPLGFIPQGARQRALQQMRQMYQNEGRLNLFAAPSSGGFAAPPSGPNSAWSAIGPQPTSTQLFGQGIFGGATSGRVTALVVNPSNANNIYLGGADGGLWMTTDGGTTWSSLTDTPLATGFPTIAVGALTVDPTSCGAAICTTVYVGTGEDNFGAENVYGEGILKCTVIAGPPASATCTQDNTFHFSPNTALDSARGGPLVGALAVNRASGKSGILLAAVRGLSGTSIPSGIWCSSDAGVNWTRVLPTGANTISTVGTDVAFGSDGTGWAALGSPFGDATNNGVYKTSAAITACTGITWSKQTLPAGLSSNIGRISLAIAPSDNNTLYAAIADSSSGSANLLGVAKTVTGISATPTWTQLNGDTRLTTNGVCNSQCFYDIPLAVSPASATTVFFGGAASNGTLIRSTDGGNTWTEISRNNVIPFPADSIHVDMHAIAFSSTGATMFVGNDGGVWKTTSPTGSPAAGFWTNLNQSLQITQFYPGVSIHPSSTGFAIGGTQDNDIQDYQGFNGTPQLWQDAGLGCDGGFTAIDFNVPSTTYGECEYIPSRLLIIATSFNNGDLNRGFLATTGIDGTDRGSFIPPLVVDPKNSNTLYFGTCRVYKTSNNGQLWSPISPDVTISTHPPNCSTQTGGILSTIAVAGGLSNAIYTGSDDGEVEVSPDGGQTWMNISGNGGPLPARSVTQVVLDPLSATGDVVYVTFSGFGHCVGNANIFCDGKGHVFKTVNGTAGAATAWVDVSGNLPDIPVNTLVVDPDDATGMTLYAGTDVGVFFTTTGGATWSPLGAAGSLPNAQVLYLTLHDASRTLRAATHGRGVWDINLGAGPNTPAFEIGKLSPFTFNAPAANPITLTVTGTGFTNASIVQWNGGARTTTPVSGTTLTATITAADLSGEAVAQVTVKDGLNTTNSLPFTVTGGAPTITSVSPTNAMLNSLPAQITVVGTGFTNSSQVVMDPDVGGTAIPTTITDSTHLSATVPASFAAGFGSTNSVGVRNPPPGGGTTVTTQTVTLPTFAVLAPAPVNDNFANAINITMTGFNDTKDSSGATQQTNDPLPPCSQSVQIPFPTGLSNTIWYKVVPTGTGMATIDTIGSNYDTVLSVWSGTSQTALTNVACNDDINPGIVTVSRLSNVTLNARTTYFIMVSSFGQADPNPVAFGGKSVLNFSFNGTLGGGGTGSFTVSGAAATVPAGMNSTSQITVTPSGGFTGTVAVTCSGLPGVTCNALNITVPSGGGNGTGNLTINVAAPSSSMTAMAMPAPQLKPGTPASGGWIVLSAGTGFAAILLLFLPGRKRYRAIFGLGLVCLISLAIGCGGGGGGGGGGPVATQTTITVSSSKVAASGSITVSANVTAAGTTPTGSVQFFDGTTALGSAVPLTNGSTGQITLTAASAPPLFQLVGTHSVSAHYLGSTGTAASQSGTLNIAVTGTTNLTITGSSGNTTNNGTVSLTIN